MVESAQDGQSQLTTGKVASDMAKLLASHARTAPTKKEALMLWQMAERCQAEAAKLDGGTVSDIGEPPACIKG